MSLRPLATVLLLTSPLFSQREPSGSPDIVPLGARLEQIFTGGVLTEGVASAPDGMIYFSDITFTHLSGMQAGHIMKFDPKTRQLTTFRSPSGMSNGLKFDAQGRMLAAEGADYGGRRVTRTDMQTGKAVIIAAMFEGRQLNSPNDITIDEKGRIYFSDPRYLGYEPIDQPFMAVYRIDPDLSVHRIITDAGKPNGVCVSPDQRTLYVVSNENGTTGMGRVPESAPVFKGRMALLAYDLASDGTAKFRRVLVDYSPEGRELAYIPTQNLPTNVGFGRGEDANLLYITEGGNVQRIRVKKKGYQLTAR